MLDKGIRSVGRIRQRRHPVIKRVGCSPLAPKNMPDGAALIRPTKPCRVMHDCNPVGRIRQRRHAAIKRAGCSPLAPKNMPDGTSLIRPTKPCRVMHDCEPVGRIRQRRHPAIKRAEALTRRQATAFSASCCIKLRTHSMRLFRSLNSWKNFNRVGPSRRKCCGCFCNNPINHAGLT